MKMWLAVSLLSLPAPVGDWAFAEAQERFVLESVGIGSAFRSLPHESANALCLMTSRIYGEREKGSKKLLERRDARACFIGLWTGDLEIGWRCRNVLRRLADCEKCNGRGVQHESGGITACPECRGVRHFWPTGDWEGM